MEVSGDRSFQAAGKANAEAPEAELSLACSGGGQGGADVAAEVEEE